MNEPEYWLGFSLVPGIGPRRLLLLVQAFGDLGRAWQADPTALRDAGLDADTTDNLLRTRAQLDLDAELAKIERVGAHLVTLADSEYPPRLREIDDAPAVLYVRGTLSAADEVALGIVGTRKATAYGRDTATFFARELARQGVTIVSGLAHGIDAAAHQAALTAGGRTIAVFGSGIDRIYPPNHAALARDMVQQGALISEFPLGSQPEPHHFPRRNRIISGLSLGVLVIEAPEKSGALITADYAAEQGREVFAVPGNIFSPASGGTNRLIQDGAKLVMTVDDILEELDLARRNIEARVIAEHIAPAGEQEAALLRLLGVEPIHVDDLVRNSGLSAADVLGTLTLLELQGYIASDGHNHYRLVNSHT